MLVVKFEGVMNHYDDDPCAGENVSKGVICEIIKDSDCLAVSDIDINIIGYEYEDEEDYYADRIKPKKIGEIKAYAYDGSKASLNPFARTFENFDGDDILFDLMDMESGDTAFYYEVLQKLYPKIIIPEDSVVIVPEIFHIVALHRLYLEPEYRGKGIGTYIMENISKILYNVANIHSLYVVGVLNPDDHTEETLAIQKKSMKKAGMTVGKLEGSTIFGGCVLDEQIM